MRWHWPALSTCVFLALAPAARADEPAPLALRSLAASCAACHGTDGRAVEGAAFVSLRGRDKDELLTQLMAFRSGAREATVMPQIAKGYTPEQLAQLAAYFAAQK